MIAISDILLGPPNLEQPEIAEKNENKHRENPTTLARTEERLDRVGTGAVVEGLRVFSINIGYSDLTRVPHTKR